MRKRTPQEIEDCYVNQGYTGEALRKILGSDREWLGLIAERRGKQAAQAPLTTSEREKYVMSTDKDYLILSKIKQLETLNLAREDKLLMGLIRTQLEHDWRGHLVRALDRLLRKYQGAASR